MNKPTIRIYQGNDEFIDREMNDAELAQYELDQATEAERKQQAETKATQRQAILDRLGITSEEAKILLGA
jgi:hypothetical protein